MIYYKDNKYCFAELFNDDTGMLIRSNTIVNGVESSFLPEARSFPELIDIGIMGACVAGKTGLCRNAGIDCYQRGMNLTKGNMSLSDYKKILDQCKGRVFQIALGGAGDPNKHESFEEILQTTRTHRIVPNYTTSGYELSDEEVILNSN